MKWISIVFYLNIDSAVFIIAGWYALSAFGWRTAWI